MCQDGSSSSRIISPPARRAGTAPTAGADGVVGWVLLSSGLGGVGVPRVGAGREGGALLWGTDAEAQGAFQAPRLCWAS